MNKCFLANGKRFTKYPGTKSPMVTPCCYFPTLLHTWLDPQVECVKNIQSHTIVLSRMNISGDWWIFLLRAKFFYSHNTAQIIHSRSGPLAQSDHISWWCPRKLSVAFGAHSFPGGGAAVHTLSWLLSIPTDLASTNERNLDVQSRVWMQKARMSIEMEILE